MDERILGSNFSPGRNVEVFELPDSESLFMPTNMNSSQMAFKFKEALLSTFGYLKLILKCLMNIM